ncbi:hypothetical protein MXD81_27560, partial [Microbacteriaceae bacterium K1510]|nr:hypothetical protein [Microbacteriaceae bacterium K1510]
MKRRGPSGTGGLLARGARQPLEIRHEHERARATCAPFAFELLCNVYAFVDRCRPRLGLGRFGLHEVDRLAGHDGRD